MYKQMCVYDIKPGTVFIAGKLTAKCLKLSSQKVLNISSMYAFPASHIDDLECTELGRGCITLQI